MLRRSTILAAILLGLLPAAATATQGDSASAHAYLVASYNAFRASTARIASVNSNVNGLARKYAQECPAAGVGSPQNEDAQQLSYEVFGVLEKVAYKTDASVIGPYQRLVKRLRWGNPRLAHAARGYALSLRELLALPTPDLCGDVRAWGATGYKTVPASTISFNRHLESIEGKPIPLSLLAPYETGSDKSLAKTVGHMQTRLENLETLRGQDWWNLILETVGLNQ